MARPDDSEFEQLVPSWLFLIRPAPARIAVALVVPLAFCIPLLVLHRPEDLRLGPFLVLAVVAVAAMAGWSATALAGTVVTALYWWYGVPVSGSFRFQNPRDVVAVGSMATLVLGITAMAHRVERSVNDVRALAQLRRDQVAEELAMRRRAEETAAEVAAARDLSNALAPGHTVADVAEIVVDRITIPAPPTAASVAVVRGQRLKIFAARGATDRTIRALESVDLTGTGWLATALAGQAVYVDDRDVFAADHPDAGILQMYPSGSWAVIPFRSGATVGFLSVYYVDPVGLSARAQYFALVAEIVATALERADAEERRQRAEAQQAAHLEELEQAFVQRDRIARTLSTTLLPPRLPAIAGCTSAGWVLPASDDQVAGDFYDMFSVREGDWVAVLGDVCGKGAEAAAVTSLARYAARVTALDDPDPARIADVANAALLEDQSDLLCTMAIARYRRDTGLLDIALAGHPQPRVITAGGEVRRLGRFGTLLGLGPTAVHPSSEPFPAGASLVLFSDGVTDRSEEMDEAAFDAMLGAAAWSTAGDLAKHIRVELLRLPAVRRDDTAVLVITRHL